MRRHYARAQPFAMPVRLRAYRGATLLAQAGANFIATPVIDVTGMSDRLHGACGSRVTVLQRRSAMVVSGLIFMVSGAILLKIRILSTIGFIVVIIGFVLLAFGLFGHAVGERRHRY
jgi:hypothetical protein